MASAAGTETGPFCRFGPCEQDHLLWMWAARWARGAAIDSSRTDCINECVIKPRIPLGKSQEKSAPLARGKNGSRFGQSIHRQSDPHLSSQDIQTLQDTLSESCGQSGNAVGNRAGGDL